MAPTRKSKKSVPPPPKPTPLLAPEPPPPPPPPPTPPPPSVVEESTENYGILGLARYFAKMDAASQFEGLQQFVRVYWERDPDSLHEALRDINYVPPKTPSATQTPLVQKPMVAESATQTPPPPPLSPPPVLKRTYASVATTPPSEEMEIDSPAPLTLTKKLPPASTRARAYVVHGVGTALPLSDTIRYVEHRTRRIAMGARWLLSAERRKGKQASSVVMYFYEPVTLSGSLVFRGKAHRVDVYEWGRANRVS